MGHYSVEADTLDQAIDKVETAEKPYDGLPKVDDSEYLDDSFTIDKEATKKANT